MNCKWRGKNWSQSNLRYNPETLLVGLRKPRKPFGTAGQRFEPRISWVSRGTASCLTARFGVKFRIVFWDVLPCKIIVDRCFRGTYYLHHQGWRTYFWNVGRQLFYTAVHPRRQFWTSYSPPWELEISQILCDHSVKSIGIILVCVMSRTGFS
jgi:hypothetical protein